MRPVVRLGGLAAIIVTAVGGTLGASPAQAQPFAGSFRALATADGIRETVTVPHAALSDRVADPGSPSAQALLDSTGTSQAYASFPYPGENVVTAPGIVAGATSGAVNLPAYPFYVSSDRVVAPTAQAGLGPYTIKAESSETSSKALSSAGQDSGSAGGAGLAKSEATAESGVDAVTARARTEITAFAAGPLRIGQIISAATVTLGRRTALAREADTQVLGAMVGQTPIAITPEGVTVGNQALGGDTAAVRQALTQAGITVELMPRQDAPTGVVAPAVQVTHKDSSGMTIVHRLGAAAAYVDGVSDVAGPSDSAASQESPTTSPSEGSSTAEQSAAPAPVEAPAAAAPVMTPPAIANEVSRSAEAQAVPESGWLLPVASAPVTKAGTPPLQSRADRVMSGQSSANGPNRIASRLILSTTNPSPVFMTVVLTGLVVAAGGVIIRRVEARQR